MRIGESVVDRLQGVEHVAPGRNGEIVEAGDLLPVNVDCRPVAFQMDDDLDPVAELLTHTAVFESGIHVRQVTFGSGYSQVDHAAALKGRFPQHIVGALLPLYFKARSRVERVILKVLTISIRTVVGNKICFVAILFQFFL